MEKGHTEKAKKSLMWLRPNKDAVEGELAGIQDAINEASENSGKALFFEMFRNPVDRRRTLLAIGAVNTQAASGAMFMVSFPTAAVVRIMLNLFPDRVRNLYLRDGWCG